MKRIQQKGLCWPSCQALSPPNCAVHLRIPPIAQFVLVSGTTRTGHNVDELGSTGSTIRSAHPASMGIYRDTIAQFKQGLVPRPEITNHSLAHHPQVRVRSQCGTESYSIFDCFRTFRVDNDKTESFAFTEVGQIIAGGLGANGAMWHRRYDRTGVAMVSNAISKNHQPYLADGGYGFPVGRRRFELRTLKHRPT